MVLVWVVGVAVVPTTAGAAGEGGAKNVVLATNTVDGSSVARDNVQVAYAPADTVANENLASAQSTDCMGCRTVAVAMQVVIVESDPSHFAPHNAAIAANGGCDSCQTYAFAFQHFVQPRRMMYLGASTQQQLAALREQVAQVASSGLSYLEMKAQLEALFAQIIDVVDSGLQAAGTTTAGQNSEASQAA